MEINVVTTFTVGINSYSTYTFSDYLGTSTAKENLSQLEEWRVLCFLRPHQLLRREGLGTLVIFVFMDNLRHWLCETSV